MPNGNGNGGADPGGAVFAPSVSLRPLFGPGGQMPGTESEFGFPGLEGIDLATLAPEEAEQILRQLAIASIPAQQARLGEAVAGLTAQIQGSPAEIRQAVAPQVEQIRSNLGQAFDVISQRLGRFGGGQIQRERAGALGGAGRQLQNLFAQQPVVATQRLLGTLQGISPVLLAQPPLQTTTQQLPFDFGALGQGVSAIGGTARALFGGPTVSPFTPFANTLAGGTGSGINPFTGGLIQGTTGILGGGV